MKRLIIAALLVAALPSSAAPVRPSTAERAFRACFSDLQRFCPGRDGFTTNACLQANYPALSDVCKTELGPPGLRPGGDPFGEERPPLGSALTNGVIRPGSRAGDRGVGGGIGGGEPHIEPGPLGPLGPQR